MLVVVCFVQVGESVFELGCGVGMVLFCFGVCVFGLWLIGLEVQDSYVVFVCENVQQNGILVWIVIGDLMWMLLELCVESFDYVISNLFYFINGIVVFDVGCGMVWYEDVLLLFWLEIVLCWLCFGGWLMLIYCVECFLVILFVLGVGVGEIMILLVSVRVGCDVGWIVVLVCKGVKVLLWLFLFFIMYEKLLYFVDVEDLIVEVYVVLCDGVLFNLWGW